MTCCYLQTFFGRLIFCYSNALNLIYHSLTCCPHLLNLHLKFQLNANDIHCLCIHVTKGPFIFSLCPSLRLVIILWREPICHDLGPPDSLKTRRIALVVQGNINFFVCFFFEIIPAAKNAALTAPAIITKARQATRNKMNMKTANITPVENWNKSTRKRLTLGLIISMGHLGIASAVWEWI